MFTRILRPAPALCLFLAFHASAAVLYVNINSTNPVAPFSSWATAATNIQDAVDAASTNDVVLVTNGVYQYGGRPLPGFAITNRLLLTNAVTVQSVNGPLVTTIAGYQILNTITGDSAVRCVYLANGASLTGFTITHGATLPGGNDVEDGGDTTGAGILCQIGDPSVVSNCIITFNVAGDFAGGVHGAKLLNCLVVSNTAQLGSYGGGTMEGSCYNCTITGNVAGVGAGDAFSNLYNCIVYGNDPGGGNYGFSTLYYCCTTPDPGGPGNVIVDPLFVNPAAGNYRLQAGSPCVDAGNNYAILATDLASNPRISGAAVDIGAYELQFHYVDINSTNPVAPFASWATAATNIQDAVDVASNYDEVLVTNGVYQHGGRAVPNSFPTPLTNRVAITNLITVQSVNGPAVTVIQGYQVPGTTNDNGAVRCVYLADRARLAGFTLTNGATLKNVLTFAVNNGGGVYCAPSNNITPSSNAIVSDCVITGNSASDQGGGAYTGVLINCVLTSNIAYAPSGNCSGGGAAKSIMTNCVVAGNFSSVGGGTYQCALTGCLVIGNSTSGFGGGAYYGSLTNCVIVSNSAGVGGGYYFDKFGSSYFPPHLLNCTVYGNTASNSGGGVAFNPAGPLTNNSVPADNCVISGNSAPQASNYTSGVILTYSCTLPLPPGPGNITNNPLFVNPASGDYHLQSNSPCINAGNNGYVLTATDLDGNTRISGGTVDIGAYEFQNPASIISYAWLQQYGFATDGSADLADPDQDGMNNYQEWLTGTDPTNPASVLRLLNPVPSGPNIIVTWQSVTNRTYFLLRASDPQAPLYDVAAFNVAGQAGTTSFTDTNFPFPGPYYYRVAVVQPDNGFLQLIPWSGIPSTNPPVSYNGH